MLTITTKNFAQTPVSFYKFDTYTQASGLSSYNAKKIIQDKFGFIWVSTQDGINKFNGKEFTIFTKNSPTHPLIGNDVYDIAEDTLRDLIWAAIPYSGINAISTITNKTTYHIAYNEKNSDFPDGWLRCLLVAKNNLWIGTNNGLTVFDINKNRFKSPQKLPFSQKKGYPLQISFITEDVYGRIWMYVSNYGFAVYDANTLQLIYSENIESFKVDLPSYTVYNGYSHDKKNKNIWIATPIGSFCFSYKKENKLIILKEPFTSEVNKLLTKPTSAIKIDDDENIWISNQVGFFKYDSETKILSQIKNTEYETENSWESTIQDIFIDDRKEIWLAVRQGIMLSSLFPSPFIKYYKSGGQKKIDHSYNLFALNDSIILACSENGLFKINTTNANISHHLNDYYFHSIFLDNKKNLIASTNKGLIKLTLTSNAITSVEIGKIYPELKPAEKEIFSSLLVYNADSVLMASKEGKGIYIWNVHEKSLKKIDTSSGNIALRDLQIKKLYCDKQGRVWILCNRYISICDFRTDKISHYLLFNPEKKSPLNLFYDIEESGHNFYLTSYGNGVVELDEKINVNKIFSTKNGLSNDGVYEMLRQNDTVIWVTSNNGLSRINTGSGKIKNYFETDGLSSNSFEERCAAVYNRFLFVGGINGVTKIDPDRITESRFSPLLYFTRYELKSNKNIIDSSNINLKKIIIPNNTNQTTIYFSALNYSHPVRTTTIYKIKETNSDWINIGNSNSLPLIGFGHGTYHLKVQVFNEDGMPSEIKELTLIFLPKWYQTWWFKTLIALTIISIGYALYRLRINQLKKEQRIRTKLASDLHDDLGSTMNSVKVYANLAIMEKQADKYLPMIKEGSQEAITGIRDIIWVLDDSKNSIEQLLSRISLFASPLCEANHIQYKQELSDHARDHKLGQEERRNLYMMLKEAVNNAIKYSQGQTITIGVSVIKGKPVIQIKDDGKGFDAGKTSDGNGLKNMQRRAREIKYRFRIESSPGSGTTLNFEKI